ncbi:MAG: hypothetical protein U1F50_08035 [Rubrivivax sp.]
MRRLLSLIALAATATVQAQGSGASAPVSATKKALVQRVLKLQQPGIEALARQLAEQPAAAMVQQVQPALARVPADKREAVARDIQADIRKYADEATPLVRDRALALAPTTIGTLLEQKLSEDELKQVATMLESPAVRKFQGLLGDMQRSLAEKVVADARPAIDPKLRALEQSVKARLEPLLAPPAAASGGKP